MQENQDIKEATIEVRKMSEDEKMQRLADLREKAIMDEKAIYAAGLDKGAKSASLKIAKKLIEANIPYKQIANITELSMEEIENLAKNLNN